MNKPDNWDTIPAKTTGEYSRPKAGAYVCKIVHALEKTSSTNRPMVELYLDIAEGEHAGHFKKLYEFLKTNNPEAKWVCVHRRCTDTEQEGYFKGDISCIEQSNDGYKFNFDLKTLIGKKVGVMFGDKIIGENQDGSPKTAIEPRWLLSTKRVLEGGMNLPKIKEMDKSKITKKADNFDDSALPF